MSNQRRNLSCTVPNDVAEKLQKIADHEGHLMSRKICKVLSDYIKDQENKHPALEKKEETESK